MAGGEGLEVDAMEGGPAGAAEMIPPAASWRSKRERCHACECVSVKQHKGIGRDTTCKLAFKEGACQQVYQKAKRG